MADKFFTYYQRADLWAPEVVAPHGAVADEIIALLPADALSILDVGCGNGAISNAIRDRRLIGVDISMSAIQFMRHPACVADLGALPFADNSFDLVMATDVLEHIPDAQYAAACAEVARVARRWILVAVPYRELLDAASVICAACGALYHVHWHQRTYDEEFLQNHWRGQARAVKWRLAGERWSWTSQPLLDVAHAIAGRAYNFPQAVCPKCDTVRGDTPSSPSVLGELDSLHYSLVEAGGAPRPPRSEILVLFDKKATRQAPFPKAESPPPLPSTLTPRALAQHENPVAYPDKPYLTDVRPEGFVLALPSLPRKIIGAGVEGQIYDGVDGAYHPADLSGESDLPDVSPTRFGYLLRVSGDIATAPTLKLVERGGPARLLHAGAGGSDQAEAARAALIELSERLEERREIAERNAATIAAKADASEAQIAALQAALERSEAAREGAEATAKRLSATIVASDARVEELLAESLLAEARRQESERRMVALLAAADEAEARRQESERREVALLVGAEEAEARRESSETRMVALLAAADEAEARRQESEGRVVALLTAVEEAEARRESSEARMVALLAAADEAEARRESSETRMVALLAAADEAEARRQESERRVVALLAAAEEAEARRQEIERHVVSLLAAGQAAEVQRDASETRMNALLAAANDAEVRRVGAERAAQAAQSALADADSRINELLAASERTEEARAAAEARLTSADQALAEARATAERSLQQHQALLAAEREAHHGTELELSRLRSHMPLLEERLAAEGVVIRPALRDIGRRFARAFAELGDWLLLTRPAPRPRAEPASLRVLVVSHMYPRPNNPVGGIFVHEQVKALRAAGIDVQVLSGEPYWATSYWPHRFLKGVWGYLRSKPETITYEGVPVTYFPYLAGAWVPHWLHAQSYRDGLEKVWRMLMRGKDFSVVHAHTAYLDGTAGRLAAERLGASLIITEHTGPFELLTNHPLKRRKTRAALRVADRVFAVSRALRQDMVRALGAAAQHVEVLGNGADMAQFDAPDEAHGARVDDTARALWIGHHVPIKRVDRLLSALAKARAEAPSLRLSLLGNGELLDTMRAHAATLGLAPFVDFLPGADRSGVAAQIRAHDFVVISSEVETFGLVAVEAMACGRPVLATACGGPQDTVRSDVLGMVVDNSEEGLVRGLVEMAKRLPSFDPKVIRAYAERAYSWDNVARQLIEVYQSVQKR